ncbi:MAG: AmpG family muropeptide MFS transporter [Candidatus Accumulibacter sp.]|jgi:PAT family beta-lactamase induction signal transducer AmpG|nr:AmpG family muropeptide MFS transporter [Accumulibacter sp.]
MSFGPPPWLRALITRKMFICVFTGFSSGLPLYLLLNLLPAWLATEGISLSRIGLLALIQLPYTWKFLWSPLLDRFAPPSFGRRRSWMLLTQVGLFLAIGFLGMQPLPDMLPAPSLKDTVGFLLYPLLRFAEDVAFLFTHPISHLAALIALLSATQDIALDAYRRETLDENELGLGSSIHVNAYRLAGLVPGSLSLALTKYLPWSAVFWITAAFMIPGAILSLCVAEPSAGRFHPRTLRDALVLPFAEFIGRRGWKDAGIVLAFIFFYKLGDSLCTALATPFYLGMGFSPTDIALVAKHAGLWPSIAGGILGGLWMLHLGINRALYLFGIVQIVSILGFAWLSHLGPQTEIGFAQHLALAAVIGFEALGVGLGTAAFVAFISRATHPAYTATQFALFSSLAAVPRTFINASAGMIVERMGWFHFFLLCALLAIPGMLLLPRVAPWNGKA